MSEPILETVFTETDALLTVAPVGRLDTVTSAQLKELMAAHPTQGRDLELDFTQVEYISSAGLRLLVALQKQVKADGHSLVIRNINAVVREVFRVSGFNKSFTVL
jgi:anti-anti-sigma factor